MQRFKEAAEKAKIELSGDDTADDSLLSVDEICAKINGLARRRVPLKCDRLTMFVDVVRQEVA